MTHTATQNPPVIRRAAPEGYAYGYTQFSRAWYAQACGLPKGVADEIMVGLYATGGGCSWEFGVRWIRLPKPTPRVEVFNDAWRAFVEVPELFTRLASLNALTPSGCRALLEELGFSDMTKVENPYPPVERCDPLDALRDILPYAENELVSLLECQRRDGGMEDEVAVCEAVVERARLALAEGGAGQRLPALVAKLNAYCREYGLPDESADELLSRLYDEEPRRGPQIEWLKAFCEEWERASGSRRSGSEAA